MNKPKGNFIPHTNKQKNYTPPAVDRMLLDKARQVAMALCGFPVSIEVIPKNGVNHYRMSAEIELMESNLIVYSYLKEFNIFYLKAHEMSANGMITFFTDLVTAIHDMGAYYATYAQIDPTRFRDVNALCRKAMNDINMGTVKLIQEQIQKS